MNETLPGLICLGIILVVVVIVWRSAAHEKERKEQFEHQKRIFEAWAAERFGPS